MAGRDAVHGCGRNEQGCSYKRLRPHSPSSPRPQGAIILIGSAKGKQSSFLINYTQDIDLTYEIFVPPDCSRRHMNFMRVAEAWRRLGAGASDAIGTCAVVAWIERQRNPGGPIRTELLPR